MSHKARTKDEQFMLKLYEESQKFTDSEDSLDRYAIGEKVGLSKKAVDTICVLLAQANFIKKRGSVEIALTPHGLKLVMAILDH